MKAQETWHSGWKNDTARISVASACLAYANEYVHNKYQGKPYNVLNVNKVIKAEQSEYQVKGKKYGYILTLAPQNP